MDKVQKLKDEVHSYHEKRKIKNNPLLTFRVPPQQVQDLTLKKKHSKKIKTIPIKSYFHANDDHLSFGEIPQYLTKSPKINKFLVLSPDTSLRLINSVSYRDETKQKILTTKNKHHKKNQSKRFTKKTIHQVNFDEGTNIHGLQKICQRTKEVLEEHEKKEQRWKKQKRSLLKQIEKLKEKNTQKKIPTSPRNKNLK